MYHFLYVLQISIINMCWNRSSKYCPKLRHRYFLFTHSDLNILSVFASIALQMFATIVVLKFGKVLGVISFPDMDLSIPRKVRLKYFSHSDWNAWCWEEPHIKEQNCSSECFLCLCVFPDVSAASAVCRESNNRAVWDTTTQVRTCYL